MTDLEEDEKVFVNNSSPTHGHTHERADILTKSPAKDEILSEKEEEEIEIEASIHVEQRDNVKDEKSLVMPTFTTSTTNNNKNSSFLIDQILSKTSKNLNNNDDDENGEEDESEANVSLNETAKFSTKASQNSPSISSSS